jgi:hypothetical protein
MLIEFKTDGKSVEYYKDGNLVASFKTVNPLTFIVEATKRLQSDPRIIEGVSLSVRTFNDLDIKAVL